MVTKQVLVKRRRPVKVMATVLFYLHSSSL
jgi:hypothetical protein